MAARAGLLLSLAFVAFISLGLPDGLLGVAWPSMRRSFGLPIAALGSLLVSTTFGYVSASFLSGAILRRIRVGTLLALSCAATACALIVYSVAPSWTIVVIFGVLTGIGAGAIDSALNTFAAHNYSARTVNMLHAFYGVGATAGPALMTAVLLSNAEWQRGYLIVGVAQLVLAAGFVATRNLWPSEHGDPDTQSLAPAPLVETLRLKATLLSAVVFILYCGLEASTGAWLFTLLHEGRGSSTAAAGAAASSFWGSLMAARIVFGLVSVRAPLSRWLFTAMIAALLATLVLGSGMNGASIAAGALIGFACGPIFPWLIAATPQRLGPRHGANAIGVQIASAAIGLSIAPALVGVVAERYGVDAIPWGLAALATLMLIAFAALEHAPRRTPHFSTKS
jgi:fucose permease